MGVQWDCMSAVYRLQDTVIREVLYNTVIEFSMPMKPYRLIKMCLNRTYSEVLMNNNLSYTFPIHL